MPAPAPAEVAADPPIATDDQESEPAPAVHEQAPGTITAPGGDEATAVTQGNRELVDVFQQALRDAEKRGRSAPQPEPIPMPAKAPVHEPDDEPDFGDTESSYDDADFARSAEAFEGIADVLDGEDATLGDAPPAPRQSQPKPPPPKRQAKPDAPERPRLTMDEAIQRIDPEARRVLTEVLKGQFKEVRTYRKR